MLDKGGADMVAEILAVGTELLLGDVLDTNSRYLSRQLSLRGISLRFRQTVGDNPDRLRSALTLALSRAELVLLCGGLGPTPDDLTSPLHPTYCMDRPHILYCKKTGKYVAWLKIMLSGHNQSMCILTADAFGGPYTVDKLLYKPLKMSCGDFCLHADPDGKAYIWFERPHFELICATLTDDYTAVTDEYSVHYPNLRPPYTREAPTYFEKDGRRYLITSGTGGYYPNPSQVCVFDDPHGVYTDLGDPCIGDKAGTSFGAQFTSVIKLPGTDRYVACADRWMPRLRDRLKTKSFIANMDKVFADYKPNREPREVTPMSGKEEKHTENTSKSRYVWLPIEWQGEKPVIRWKRKWKTDDQK